MAIEWNRRRFISAAATVVGAAAMAPALSACSGSPAQQTGANTESGLRAALPAYLPNTTIRPEIPSVAGGPDVLTDAGFLTYPANPVTTVSGVPGKGGSYTAVTPLWGTVPSAGNSFYQAMNKALGVNLTMKPANGNNYNTIIPTMTAAKRLPDWIQLPGLVELQLQPRRAGRHPAGGPHALPGRRQDQEVPQPGGPPDRRLAGRGLGRQALRHPDLRHRLRPGRPGVLPARRPRGQGHHRRPGASADDS